MDELLEYAEWRVNDLLRALADMTSQRNGWGDTAQEYLSERDAARADADRLAGALRFHNQTTYGHVRRCLDGCIACAVLADHEILVGER